MRASVAIAYDAQAAAGRPDASDTLVEAEAIAEVIGRHALVSSTKSMLGHTIGASGALEAVVTALTLRDQVVHPTLNLEQAVADLPFPTAPTRAHIEHAVSQSFAFGGHDAVIALSRVD